MHYRQLAADSIHKAQDATTEEMQAGHLSMAAGWHALALELEQSCDSETPPGDSAGEPLPVSDRTAG